jgi:hypothetical protein
VSGDSKLTFKQLHQELHKLREGIGGDDWKTPEWLRRKCAEVLNLAYTASPIDVDALKELQAQLETLNETDTAYDVERRVKIDQLACKILNAQEASM